MFGDIITLDNVNILNPKKASRHGDKTVCVMIDRYAGWMAAIPSPNRTTEAIVHSLQQMIGRKNHCELLYFDNANEYIAAARFLQIKFNTRTANRPQSNGVAERAVRRVLEGARTLLHKAGLPHCYWPEACQAYTALRNFHDEIRKTNMTAHEHRLGTRFKGLKIPLSL